MESRRTIADDECARIEWESLHQIDRGKLDIAAEKRERIAARLKEVMQHWADNRNPGFGEAK